MTLPNALSAGTDITEHETPTSTLFQTVLPELSRLLLSQHLQSIEGEHVSVDEFAVGVEKAMKITASEEFFLGLRAVRPDYVQFIGERLVWEEFCGTPSQKENPNYRPFPAKDPSIDNPLPSYIDLAALTPGVRALIYRDRAGSPPGGTHGDGGGSSRAQVEGGESGMDWGVGVRATRSTTPGREYEEYEAFRERLEAQSRRLGYKDSDERWERECEMEEERERERERELEREREMMGSEGGVQTGEEEVRSEMIKGVGEPKPLVKPKDKRDTKRFRRCSAM